jgi:hypothetical protein
MTRLVRPLPIALAILALATATAIAEEAPYRDDRSDPAAIVASYYNAIARQEYARAWGYFGAQKPVAHYPAFVAGFAGTAGVTVEIGTVTTDGAAGSVYGSVPVAVTAAGADGKVTVYAGCYTTRQLQPAIQEPPFHPLEILEGKLALAEGTAATAIPSECPVP